MKALQNLEPRLYQQMIFSECIKHSGNTLVVLPTGLGKTVIMAYLVAYNLQKKPDQKILISTPTKPLVRQITKMFLQFISELNEDQIIEVSGLIPPDKRVTLYEDAKVIVGTPQTIENDFTFDRLNSHSLGLILIDEAHRATGNYAYVTIAKSVNSKIIGFTATPGNDKDKILEVCNNLKISNISLTNKENYDVAKFISVHKPKLVWIDLPESYKSVLDLLNNFQSEILEPLKKPLGIRGKAQYFSKRDALAVHQQALQLMKNDPHFGELLVFTANLIRVQHLREIVETQGFPQTLAMLKKWRAKQSSKALSLFFSNEYTKMLMQIIQKNPIIHPKLDIVLEHINKSLENVNTESRIIVFSNYRDTIRFLYKEFQKNKIDTDMFVGHSSSVNDKGLSQKEQLNVLEKFKKGEIKVLLSTSIGEEGLDVGNCDLVVFYDSVPSVVRTVQRKGRGRKKQSKVLHLITKNTRDQGMYYAIKRKEKVMNRFLKEELPTLLSPKSPPKQKGTALDNFLKKDTVQIRKNIETPEIVILVDTRETSSNVPKLLKEFSVILKPQELPVGDYVVSERVIIERKEINDFVNSIMDGRLFSRKITGEDSQLSRLSNAKIGILLIEGSFEKISRNINIASVIGAISSIIIDFKISILFTSNEKETASFIYNLARKEQIEKKIPLSLPTVTKKDQNPNEIQEFILSSIPGINLTKAKTLLNHFGSLSNLITCNSEQIQELPGFGKTLADRIITIFNNKYISEI